MLSESGMDRFAGGEGAVRSTASPEERVEGAHVFRHGGMHRLDRKDEAMSAKVSPIRGCEREDKFRGW